MTATPPIRQVPGRMLTWREPAGVRWHGIATPAPWMKDGVCTEVDPEIFFVNEKDFRAVRRAKNVCATCPVQLDCAEYAIKRPHLIGIWGGLTDSERWKYRR